MGNLPCCASERKSFTNAEERTEISKTRHQNENSIPDQLEMNEKFHSNKNVLNKKKHKLEATKLSKHQYKSVSDSKMIFLKNDNSLNKTLISNMKAEIKRFSLLSEESKNNLANNKTELPFQNFINNMDKSSSNLSSISDDSEYSEDSKDSKEDANSN
mmetsp:Transcript_17374/g.15332  ORF Transcript_17374/g.15332 Transcript_17374/m.15332 type:complete len:158 (-) Transcript_17374:69-542(-)